MTSVAEQFAMAIRLHQGGNPTAAEYIYQQVLQADPANADAQCMLGVCYYQTGRHDQAEAAIKRAIAMGPAPAHFYCNLGLVHQALGKIDDAIGSYTQALRIQPHSAEAHCVLGGLLRVAGRPGEAEAHCREALRVQPDFAQAYNNLGLVYYAQRQWQDSEAQFRAAIRLNPQYGEAHSSFGRLLTEMNRMEEAEFHLRESLRINPRYCEALNGLGVLKKRQCKWEEAAQYFLEIQRLVPDYSPAWTNLGEVRKAQLRFDEALKCFDRALEMNEPAVEAHYNRALLLLLLGRWQEAWPQFEWRFRFGALRPVTFAQPRWDGSPLGERTLMLMAEQGLGDTLQFIRYAQVLKQRGNRVIIHSRPALERLLKLNFEPGEVVVEGEPLPDFDVYAPLLSVLGLLSSTPTTVPADVPYLKADPKLVEVWRGKLAQRIPDQATKGASKKAFRVGIAWQGNPDPVVDRGRSIPLAEFAPMGAIPNVQLISLQKGPGAEQLANLRGRFSVLDLGDALDRETGPFMDTAAVMKNLDLVITSDTSIAHLAGALGVRVWLALALVPDWRWLLGREDSLWYPTMRLFRQAQWGNWGDIFQRMATELKSLVSRQEK